MNIRLPEQSTTKILHWRHHAVVLHLKCCGDIESLEVGTPDAFLLIEELLVGVQVNSYRVHGRQFGGMDELHIAVVIL